MIRFPTPTPTATPTFPLFHFYARWPHSLSILDLEGFSEEAKGQGIPEECNLVSLTTACAFHSRAHFRLSLLDLLGDYPGETACMCTCYLSHLMDYLVRS